MENAMDGLYRSKFVATNPDCHLVHEVNGGGTSRWRFLGDMIFGRDKWEEYIH